MLKRLFRVRHGQRQGAGRGPGREASAEEPGLAPVLPETVSVPECGYKRTSSGG